MIARVVARVFIIERCQAGPNLPMRNELAIRRRSSSSTKASDPRLVILAFCLVGLVASLYFAVRTVGPNQLPLLVLEYNSG
jgi:hypothetical protein